MENLPFSKHLKHLGAQLKLTQLLYKGLQLAH